MEMMESPSPKAFRQTSPTMNSQSFVLAKGWLEDLMRSSPALLSVNAINKTHSYFLRAGVLLLGVEKRQKGPNLMVFRPQMKFVKHQ